MYNVFICAGVKFFEFWRKYIFVARKKRGCGFLHSKPLPPPLSSDDAIEIELTNWLVNRGYVICKQTRESIVTKSAPVGLTKKVLAGSMRAAKCHGMDDYTEDGGEELFSKMHCILITNPTVIWEFD